MQIYTLPSLEPIKYNVKLCFLMKYIIYTNINFEKFEHTSYIYYGNLLHKQHFLKF